jgi:hypothetical protein
MDTKHQLHKALEDNAPIFVDTSSGYEEPNAELGCTFRTEGYAKES